MQTKYIITSPDAVVSPVDGFIEVFGLRSEEGLSRADTPTYTLSQKAAIDLALELVQAVRLSQDRNQVNVPAYYDSARILERMESPLGKAESALKKVFGL